MVDTANLEKLLEDYAKILKEAVVLSRSDLTLLNIHTGVSVVGDVYTARCVLTVAFNVQREHPVVVTNEFSSTSIAVLEYALAQDIEGAENRLNEIKLKLEEEKDED